MWYKGTRQGATMSNSTPPAIRARDKARKAQEKHPKQIENERKARLSSGAKRVISVLGTILAILTAFSTVQSFFPHLTISENGTVRSHDPMGTIFNLTNNGILPVREVDQVCGIDRIRFQGGEDTGFGLQPQGHLLGYLARGATKSLNCEHAIAMQGTSEAKISIEIIYKPILWPTKLSKYFQLEAEKADDGTWLWKSV
jgi:hypothetical protein